MTLRSPRPRGPLPAGCRLVWPALLLVLLAACAGARVGRVQHSREVARAFETYHVEPGYRYYHYHQENNPYAVVGLAPGHFIDAPDWRPLDPNTKSFEKVIDLVKDFPEHHYPVYGSYLLDSQGRRIGMWYSSLPPPGVRLDPDTGRVSLTTTRPWLDDDPAWRPAGGVGVGIGIGTGGSGVGVRMGW